MHLKKVNFGKHTINIESKNTKEDNNYYTALIGDNGTGKTRLFETILSNQENIECKKIIFSTYSLFNRKLDLKKSSEKKVYLSNFDSKNIIYQVSQMYIKNSLNESNGTFEKALREVSNIIGIDSSPKISIKGLTSLAYPQISSKINATNNKNNKKFGKNDLYELSKHRLEITNNVSFSKFKEKLFGINKYGIIKKNIQKLEKYYIHEEEREFLDESQRYLHNNLLFLKLMFMDNREKQQYKESVQNVYSTEELIQVYKYYYDLSDEELVKKLIKIDLKICDILNINFASDIAFYKTSNDGYKLLTQFSSGEFALFVRIIDIASKISQDTLVLIDEPETFLNPKWVFEFIYLLKKLFKNQRSHFIIASQSPFIVGSLSKEDIIKIGKNELGEPSIIHESTETFGADFNDILNEVFNVNFNDNKLAQKYLKEIENVGSSDILKSIEMLKNLADSSNKIDLILDLSSEKNINLIKREIEKIESEFYNE